VQQLVELHGGSVEAASDGPGQGSEFVVRLPRLGIGAAMPEPSLESQGVQDAEPAPARTASRILVVDDNRDSAESMALLLRLAGHTTSLAYDGRDALEFATVQAPDVVVLDIGLPGMDGYEIARRLRALPQTRDSLLIALTGYGQEEDLRRSRAAGFNEHFIKPVDIDLLLRTVARHPRARSGERPAATNATES